MPFHGSGSVAARKSSMENLTSTPFSKRDSGSAFINQYDRPSTSSSSSSLSSSSLSSSSSETSESSLSTDCDLEVLASEPLVLFCRGYLRGLPTGRLPSRGVEEGLGVTVAHKTKHRHNQHQCANNPGCCDSAHENLEQEVEVPFSDASLRGRPRPRLGPGGGLGVADSGYLRGRPRFLFSPITGGCFESPGYQQDALYKTEQDRIPGVHRSRARTTFASWVAWLFFFSFFL